MPSQRQLLQLNLESEEEDIGESSPYLSARSATSSRASSSTINSSLFTSSPRSEDDFNSDIPLSSLIIPETTETPKTQNFPFQFQSSSSPSLPNAVILAPQIPRSQTIPRVLDNGEPASRQMTTEISALPVDPSSVQKVRRWILGIAVVEFDLDHGPIVEGIYPPLVLLPAESETISFCSFPDSLQFDQGSQTHSFRIREQLLPSSSGARPPTKDGFFYGFSHFIQKRDPTSKRGYQQRSLVILTHLQYPAFFTALATLFGPSFESLGSSILEVACQNIATWPDPIPGQTYEFGFLGNVLHVELPQSIDAQQLTETSSFNEKYNPKSHILAATAPLLPPPLLLFEASLANVWSIWECLVLCEPILVFGASPAQTSQAIWWLRDLMRPIPLACDLRPYFTMQDSDHAQLVNKLPPKAGLVLGVTNPFFEKSCAHWPHVLSLGRRIVTSSSPRQNTPLLGASAGPAPGWRTRTHKRYISKDRVLLKQLENAIKGDQKMRLEASFALRRHFCSRTAQLLAPLARYLNSLIPSPAEVHRARKISGYPLASSIASSFPSPMPSPHVRSAASTNINQTHQLRLKPFNSVNFLASLKDHGSTLPFKSSSKRTAFYERWLKSPSFGSWLAQQEDIVQNLLNDSTLSSVDSPRPRVGSTA